MTQTLEGFIGKLQAEGVAAGQEAAQRIEAEAQARAAGIVQAAERQARDIVAAAEAERERIRARTESELKLAARDSVLRLRAVLQQVLEAALTRQVEAQMADTDFMATLVREVIMQYVRADVVGQTGITLTVREELKGQLVDWAMNEFREERQGAASLNLRWTLKTAGFEYQVSDGTVEVTVASVARALSDLAAPELRRLLDEAAAEPVRTPQHV